MIRYAFYSLSALAALGCMSIGNSRSYYDDPWYGGGGGDDAPTFDPTFPGAGGLPNISFPPVDPTEPSGAPTDTRPVVEAKRPPPPVSGGTLLITHDGKRAVAADPDRDRVSIVGLSEKAVLATVSLETGDEPGRLVEDDAGRVHVALRRGGAIVSIEIETGTLLRRTAVCGAPRGIAFDAATKLLHVACAGGELVSLPADGGDPTRRLTPAPDLRDIVVTADGLVVSQFKSANLIRVDADGNVAKTIVPPGADRISSDVGAQRVEPAVAWRAITSPAGDVRVLHQYDLDEPIEVGDAITPQPVPQPYGAPLGGCGGLVQPVVSTLGPGDQFVLGAPLAAPVMAVDVAISFDGEWLALAHAGTVDPVAESPVGPNRNLGRVSIVSSKNIAGDTTGQLRCSSTSFDLGFSGQTTAVAFNPAGDATAQAEGTWMAVQTREPASIVLVGDAFGQKETTISLGGDSVLDTGHDIFHRDAGAGIACASCHAEGAEDGRVWKFSPIGNRRTQSVNVGLSGTEPFHWDGDVPNLGSLVELVFVHRMGGPHEDPTRVAALQKWLGSLTPPARIVDSASAEATRGRALFESKDVGCSGCHKGEKFTSNDNAFVGTTDTGVTLQVPSLVGVGFRAPYLHNGCAKTLDDRFDPACGGGDHHGITSSLSKPQIDDIVSYLKSL